MLGQITISEDNSIVSTYLRITIKFVKNLFQKEKISKQTLQSREEKHCVEGQI